MNRILFERGELSADGLVWLSGRRARHVASVLRSRPGDIVRVGELNGATGTAEVLDLSADHVLLRPELESVPCRASVDLLLAMPRPKVMRRLWSQLAALGVGRIILVNASRVERCYFDTHWLDPEVYRGHIIEGLEQSGDTMLPEVQIQRSFRVTVEDLVNTLYGPEVLRVLADPDEEECRTAAVTARALLAVGPEGGWIPFERELLKENGFTPFSLGWRTLRTDTACIALLSVLSERLKTPGTVEETNA